MSSSRGKHEIVNVLAQGSRLVARGAVAKAVGRSIYTISKWEYGQPSVSMPTLTMHRTSRPGG
jgi:hypothetical protein